MSKKLERDGIHYEYNDQKDGWCITSADKNIMEAVIPYEIDGKPVKEIKNEAFCGCKKLTTAYVPDSVEMVGDHAFGFCDSLNYIRIPDTTYVGVGILAYCGHIDTIVTPWEKRFEIDGELYHYDVSGYPGVASHFETDGANYVKYDWSKGPTATINVQEVYDANKDKVDAPFRVDIMKEKNLEDGLLGHTSIALDMFLKYDLPECKIPNDLSDIQNKPNQNLQDVISIPAPLKDILPPPFDNTGNAVSLSEFDNVDIFNLDALSGDEQDEPEEL